MQDLLHQDGGRGLSAVWSRLHVPVVRAYGDEGHTAAYESKYLPHLSSSGE